MKSVVPLLLLTTVVLAQPASRPVESVTVTGTRSRAVLQTFVETFATPTRLTGKLARWQNGVCPVTMGLKPKFTSFISQRLRDVARQVGAPVNDRTSCKPNIEIVFTTKPQELLNNIRKHGVAFLGYADTPSKSDELAKVTRPIQAWYLTASKDLDGKTEIDSARIAGIGMPIRIPAPVPPGYIEIYVPGSAARVTGSRLGDGVESGFYNILIVAEPGKLLEHEVGTLADYITMLALSQVNGLDHCQQLPSITSLLAPNCERAVTQLTAADLAYLRGLYSMSPGRDLRIQEDEVIYQMQQSAGD